MGSPSDKIPHDITTAHVPNFTHSLGSVLAASWLLGDVVGWQELDYSLHEWPGPWFWFFIWHWWDDCSVEPKHTIHSCWRHFVVVHDYALDEFMRQTHSVSQYRVVKTYGVLAKNHHLACFSALASTINRNPNSLIEKWSGKHTIIIWQFYTTMSTENNAMGGIVDNSDDESSIVSSSDDDEISDDVFFLKNQHRWIVDCCRWCPWGIRPVQDGG